MSRWWPAVKRGAAVRESLELPAELAAQLHTPAGLDIGARTPAEIAISILAELIAVQHAEPAVAVGQTTGDDTAARSEEAPADKGSMVVEESKGSIAVAEELPNGIEVAIDPVCGMKIAVTESTLHLDVAGTRVYFCGTGCRLAYTAPQAPDAAKL